jgi:hypothetical protein
MLCCLPWEEFAQPLAQEYTSDSQGFQMADKSPTLQWQSIDLSLLFDCSSPMMVSSRSSRQKY